MREFILPILGVITVVLGLLFLAAPFFFTRESRLTRDFGFLFRVPTRKTFAFGYLALTIFAWSLALFLIVYDPTKAQGIVMVTVGLLFIFGIIFAVRYTLSPNFHEKIEDRLDAHLKKHE